MIKEAISLVVDGHDLSENMMVDVMNQVMCGEATAAQIGSLITALRMKGETIEEITGAARVMRQHATPIRVSHTLDIDRDEINVDQETILDTCGTGGSGTKSFNISTTVAFIVASCGVKVAKHGNRSVSSACGSADVLEELGVNLNIPPEIVEQCVQELSIGFLFAPALHGAMKYAIGPRREVGIRTIFNILGPLTNPAGADHQVLGVYKKSLVQPIAEVLNRLGCKRGFVVHGADGMDEVTLTAETTIASIEHGVVTVQQFHPESLGFSLCKIEELQGGDAVCNAAIIRSVLSGKPGPRRDIVLINSAFALVAAGVVGCLEDGVSLAKETIDNGLASEKLASLVRMTNQ